MEITNLICKTRRMPLWNRKFCLKFFLLDLSFQALSSQVPDRSIIESYLKFLFTSEAPLLTALGTNILQLNIRLFSDVDVWI